MSNHLRIRTLAVVALLLAIASASLAPATARPRRRPPAAVTIAIIGDSSINVLHEDFKVRPGAKVRYPATMPTPTIIHPPGGDFESAMAELRKGPLGRMRPGELYAISGTRLLVYAPTGPNPATTVIPPASATDEDPLLHGTGVTSAAIGTRYGTAPDAVAVFIPGFEREGWKWIADQKWIDVVSTSVYPLPIIARAPGDSAPVDADPCAYRPEVKEIVGDGRVVFSSSGNTTDPAEPLISPNGLPEVYQVGGVDASGKTWTPGHLEESDPWWAFGNVIRPYDTGELYSFTSAAGDSYSGKAHFGGTSGATPRTAGWAARLIQTARRILAGTTPSSGPLADGRFSREELIDLLHHTAAPAEEPSPGRYFIEGYGAVNEDTIALAESVLAGTAAEPERPEEDAAHEQTLQARELAFSSPRCS